MTSQLCWNGIMDGRIEVWCKQPDGHTGPCRGEVFWDEETGDPVEAP